MNSNRINVRKIVGEKNPKLLKRLPNFLIRYLEKIVHQQEINELLDRKGHLKNQDFCRAIIDEYQFKISITGKEKIPQTGPVILVMNHPLGGVDGLALITSLIGYREDLIFIVNDILLNIEQLKDLFIGVNKHGKNKGDVRHTIKETFHSHKAVCVFPAGLVSRYFDGKIQDSEWKRTFVTYAKDTKHPIIPIHISGKLSPFFYGLYRIRTFFKINANIEMLYLSNEMYKQKGKEIKFTVGNPITFQELDTKKSDIAIAQDIKEILYQLPIGI